jgi:hypothetical protein
VARGDVRPAQSLADAPPHLARAPNAHRGTTRPPIRRNEPPIIHLVLFPQLTINHGMVLFDAIETGDAIRFQAYDPNDSAKPTLLSFDCAAQTFFLPANRYWAGGKLDVIEIYRGWLL